MSQKRGPKRETGGNDTPVKKNTEKGVRTQQCAKTPIPRQNRVKKKGGGKRGQLSIPYNKMGWGLRMFQGGNFRFTRGGQLWREWDG